MANNTVIVICDQSVGLLSRALRSNLHQDVIKLASSPETAQELLLHCNLDHDTFQNCSGIIISLAGNTVLRITNNIGSIELDTDAVLEYFEHLLRKIRDLNPDCPVFITPVVVQMLSNFVVDNIESEYSLIHFCTLLNLKLSLLINTHQNILLSSSCLTSHINSGKEFKTFLRTKSTVSLESIDKLVDEFKAFITRASFQLPKLIFIDLDNTLWHGIISDSFSDIRIGGHDPVGEAYFYFQKYLKKLSTTGVLLAIVSKNDYSLVESFFSQNPEMPLNLHDFVACEASWGAKSDSISKILKSLNIRSQDCAFIDDSPHERSEVNQSFPDLRVLSPPENVYERLLYFSKVLPFSDRLPTEEDKKRVLLYRQRALRAQNLSDFSEKYTESKDKYFNWLCSLGIQLHIYSDFHINPSTRVLQIYNRTNQFNMSGRHISHSEMSGLLDNECELIYARATDKFGDDGIVISAIVHLLDTTLYFKEFVMSCRVIGRHIEEAFLNELIRRYPTVQVLNFDFNDTSKNTAFASFLHKLEGDKSSSSAWQKHPLTSCSIEAAKVLRYDHINIVSI